MYFIFFRLFSAFNLYLLFSFFIPTFSSMIFEAYYFLFVCYYFLLFSLSIPAILFGLLTLVTIENFIILDVKYDFKGLLPFDTFSYVYDSCVSIFILPLLFLYFNIHNICSYIWLKYFYIKSRPIMYFNNRSPLYSRLFRFFSEMFFLNKFTNSFSFYGLLKPNNKFSFFYKFFFKN